MTKKLFVVKGIDSYNYLDIAGFLYKINDHIERLYKGSVKEKYWRTTLLDIPNDRKKIIIVDSSVITEEDFKREEELLDYKQYILINFDGSKYRLHGEILENDELLSEIENEKYLNYSKREDDYGVKYTSANGNIDVIISSCPDSFYSIIGGKLILLKD